MSKWGPSARSMLAISALLLIEIDLAHAQEPPATQLPATQPTTRATATQAKLEADFAAAWTDVNLEGWFTSTGVGQDAARLRTDRYSLGSVRKLAGKIWIINARIGNGANSKMIPLPLPIEWAGDTPVIVVDNMTIPGMGTYTARVMFFDGHYSGYWKHNNNGGILFGVVRRSPTTATSQPAVRE